MKTMARLMMALLVLGAGYAFADVPVAEDEVTVEGVLARFVAAVGGADALGMVTERYSRGTIVQDLTWTDPRHQEIPFVAYCDVDWNVRYAQKPDWAALSEVGDGGLQDKLCWLMHPCYALVVEDEFPDLELVDVSERDGRRVAVLCSADQKFAYHALYFDLETGLLSHIGYHNDVTDYRDVGGILYPHRVVFGRKGGHTTYAWEEIRIGP